MAELVVFIVAAIGAVFGAVAMVMARNTVYSAMGLMLTMFSVAVLYVLNLAHFVAAVQVMIYAGAVMTLFLFVIMFIGVDRLSDPKEQIPFQRPVTILAGLGFLGLVLVAGRAAWITGPAGDEVNGTIEAVADEIFGAWLFPFEVTALLLTIAAIGSVALAKFRPKGRSEEVAE